MANKIAFGLIAAGLVSALGITTYQNVTEKQTTANYEQVGPDWRAKVRKYNTVGPEPIKDYTTAKAPVETPQEESETVAQSDPLGDWAVRAYEAEQNHQDKCWDQLETRGYGDPNCY